MPLKICRIQNTLLQVDSKTKTQTKTSPRTAKRCTLCQVDEDIGPEHPTVFASCQLSQAERNYTTTERECLAMIFSVKKFRHYLLMNPMVFFVDHIAIKYLINKLDLSGRVARWILLLSEFDYTIEFKPRKKHLRADHLSRLFSEVGLEDIDDEFLEDQIFAV